MDSGNSASLQSSSGGDDEFDSRCGSGGGVDSSPLSALLRQSAASSPSFYGLQDLASPPTHLPPLSHAAAHQWTTAAAAVALPGGGGASPSPSSSPHGGVQGSGEQVAAAQQGVSLSPPAMRGPSRKRTRASRRAPTTVLTTDTSNFRAMVQEFTGIPSPPFAGGAPARSRFDHLFPAPSSLRSAAAVASGGGSPSSLPAYLLRPFSQKLHHPSPFPTFPSPTTSSPSPSNIAIATSAPTTVAVAAAPIGDRYHQLASAPSSSLLGMQDHGGGNYLSFQSHLAGDHKFAAHPMFDATPPQRMQDPAGFLGLTHGVMAGAADGTHMHHHQRSRRDLGHGHGGDELSGVVGGASMTTGSGCGKKTAYSSGERNAESTSVTVAATTATSSAATAAMRTQSVDSWICTSE